MAAIVRPAWMSDEMYQEWFGYFLDAGGTGVAGANTRATELFRASKNYERYFPGIKREDGAVRYPTDPEETYYDNVQAYKSTIEGLGLKVDIFGEDIIDLITGDVSPNEFAQRTTALEARVMSQGPAIRDWYAQAAGVDFTSEGILASLMSSRVDQAVLSKQITMAEIGGEGASRGFDLSAEFVNMLAQEGMDRADADRMFGSAERLLPALSALARRHADPDSTFDITEFAAAEGLGDPEQLARMDRLQAQEQAQFKGGLEVEYQRSRATGGVSGLGEV